MAIEIKLPDMGENIETGTIVTVMVSPGDTIEIDQPVVEIETDKAVVEVPSNAAGVVSSVEVQEGDEVRKGEVLVTLEESGEDDGSDDAQEPDEPADDEAERDSAPPEEEPAETPDTEEDDATQTPPESEKQTDRERDESTPDTDSGAERALVPASPSVRRLAREIGIDIAQVTGSGPGGRISDADVKAHAKKLNETRAPASGASIRATASRELPDFTKWGDVEREKLSRLRIAVAENMAHAWNAVPHVTQEDRADITDIERMRKESASLFEKEGTKLTPTAIAVKIAGEALKRFPKMNASIDIAKQEAVLKKYVNIGVAVDTDRGLVVPVIKDVPNKSLLQISKELIDIAKKARDGKLSLDEMQGGTFTITNLGGLGTTQFTPIVNWPEVAILGMSRSSFQPTWNDEAGSFQPRLILPLSVSYDHRLIDGADAARFLRWIAMAFERPILMI